MAILESELKKLLENGFPEAQIKIIDTVGDSNHYQVTIVCDSFKGLRLLEQHKKVYEVLKQELKQDLHALSLITKTKSY